MNSPNLEKAVPNENEKARREAQNPLVDSKSENAGDPVTRTQQLRILSSTCLVAFTVIGYTQSFGVFQAHYGRHGSVQEGVLHPNDISQRALISTIGSFGNGGLVAAFAVFYYPYLPKLGGQIKSLCAVGTVLIAIGFGTAAGSHNLATLVGCQGILAGLGAGILIYVLTPILPEYFPEHGGLAQGVMFASAALGSMVWVFVLTKVLEGPGIRWALGVLAMSSAVLLSLASALALPPRKFETRCTHIVSRKTFLDPLFVSLAIVNFIHPLTMAIPMVFGPQFAGSIGASITQASYLLAINSAVGIPGRLCTGWLADKIGHLNVLVVATAIYASAIWALWLSAALTSNMGLCVAMSVCHGISNGIFNTVMASAQKTLFGPEMYYPKMGATISIRGIGYVIGTPIAGALVSRIADEDLRGDDFVRPIVYTGVLVTISLLCLVNVRWLDAKKDGWKLAR